MPKYAVHKIIMEEAIKILPPDMAREMDANKTCATIGCVGPDLFFWGTDYEKTGKLFDFYREWEKIKVAYDKIMAPITKIKDDLRDAADHVPPAVFGPSITEIRALSDNFQTLLTTTLFSGLIGVNDWLSDVTVIENPLQNLFQKFTVDLNSNIKEWPWFDVLHYRRTGEFAKNLVGMSKSPAQNSLARGYLTHIASDIAGHPFVNQIVGSPFRISAQRHATVENYMDAWKFERYYQKKNIVKDFVAEMALPETIPGVAADLYYKAFKATYPSTSTSGYRTHYTKDDIAKSYDNFMMIQKVSANGGFWSEKPEPKYDEVFDVLQDIMNHFEPPPEVEVSPHRRFSLRELLKYLAELIKWAFETIANLIDLIINASLTVSALWLASVVYGIHSLLYTIFRSARTVLSSNGLVYPDSDEVGDTNPLALDLLTPRQCQVANLNYPFSHMGDDNLSCPVRDIEQPPTIVGFATETSNPDFFIKDDTFQEANYKLLSQLSFEEYCVTRQYSVARQPIEARLSSFGNATDLAAWMIKSTKSSDPNIKNALYANWNLDSDRGYAYRCFKKDATGYPFLGPNED
jgi:hypothetical protein